MTARRHRKSRRNAASQTGWHLLPRDDEPAEAADHDRKPDAPEAPGPGELEDAQVLDFIAENPELVAKGMDALREWHDTFVRESGREPTDEDLEAIFDMDDAEWEAFLERIEGDVEDGLANPDDAGDDAEDPDDVPF